MMKNLLLYLSSNRIANKAAKKFGRRLGADRFVAGDTLNQAIDVVKQLNSQGLRVTLDHLGEFVTDPAEADQAADEVIATIDAIAAAKAEANVSLKLTQLGLDLSYDECFKRMKRIVARAVEQNVFVRMDMEDYARNEATIRMYEALDDVYSPHIGIVIQAYLYKAGEDMTRLKQRQPNYRLVKGAYKEATTVAYEHKTDVDENFKQLIFAHLANGHYAAVATHDEAIIQATKEHAKQHHIPVTQFEFQMLYGIRTALQHALVKEGYPVRVYVPYGVDWYGYFMRRMAERPENLTFVLKSMAKK
ncbi:L-proline dehydrogenase [Aureibacillus halotolerans]|uniref:proline dehydrogenase n=2 Tax=Aureibacillus halotolerans TaxID=1508390 RepID=A0A4R6U5P8_9BACI|nr:L-proline dehydrogenase [Aureibacillus halotolerans]